jgi:hypothetical protein
LRTSSTSDPTSSIRCAATNEYDMTLYIVDGAGDWWYYLAAAENGDW